jgi:hypothetical protein
MHLNEKRREKGTLSPWAVEAISLGFAISATTDLNTSGLLWVLVQAIYSGTTNYLGLKPSSDIMYQAGSDGKWVVYFKLYMGNYTKVCFYQISDIMPRRRLCDLCGQRRHFHEAGCLPLMRNHFGQRRD